MVAAPVAGAGIVRVQVAVGGADAGGLTVGAAVAGGVGVGVGLAVDVGLGEGLRLGLGVTGVSVRPGLAEATAEGLGEAATSSAGRRSATSRLPLRSWSRTVCARSSILPTPWRAARNAVSCVMTSCAHAIRVVASGPIAATVPFVV